METRQPTLRIGRNVWDQIDMPEAEFQARVEIIRREMKKEKINVLLIYSNAFTEYANTCYVSNYVIRLPRGTLVVVPQKGEVALFFEGSSRGLPFAKTTTWVKDVMACTDVSKECVKYLQEKAFLPATIGMVGLRQLMPYYQFTSLTEALGQSTLVDADHIIEDMRMVKTIRECDQIRRSSRIVKHIFDFVTSTPFPNTNERVIEALIYREAHLEGAEDVRVLIAKPQQARWALRLPEDVTINTEQSVILYVALAFERYWSEGIRSFCVRDASFEEPGLEHIQALYGRLKDRMKPGNALSHCYSDAIAQIKKSNVEHIPDYGLGHGIGLNLQELPEIAAGESRQLREGMCLTLRLALKDATMGAVMVGNTLRVSEKGAELLTI